MTSLRTTRPHGYARGERIWISGRRYVVASVPNAYSVRLRRTAGQWLRDAWARARGGR